jgi:tRNA pseudouridine55 synthase
LLLDKHIKGKEETVALDMKSVLHGMVFVITLGLTTTLRTFKNRIATTSVAAPIFVTGFPPTKTPARRTTSKTCLLSTSTMQTPQHPSPTTAVGQKRKLVSLQSTTIDADQSEEKEKNTTPPSATNFDAAADVPANVDVPIYLAEGLLAVDKPLNWTSQDVVSYVRGILMREARDRGANPAKPGRKNKSRQIKVGHGGTLDPLASGVLVLGVGKGTKELTKFLQGSKAYRATGRLGVETTTLDLDPKANVTQTKPWDHTSFEQIEKVLPKFVGKIQQIPPVFSAKRLGGKRAYEVARKEGVDSVKMEPREVEIHRLDLLRQNDDDEFESTEDVAESKAGETSTSSTPKLGHVSSTLPDFTIAMECGGGTFVRSLIRDIAYELDTVATTARLQRTKQGPFKLGDCISKDNWTADNIYAEIRKWNEKLSDDDGGNDEEQP